MRVKIITEDGERDYEIELDIIDIREFVELLKVGDAIIDEDGNTYEYANMNYDLHGNYFEIIVGKE